MTQEKNRACPVAAALDNLGDKWTLLIVREAMNGVTRFNDFWKNTGIAKNLLSDRLGKMIGADILETNEIAANGTRHEYRLTPKGLGLTPILLALGDWASEWVHEESNKPVRLADLKNARANNPSFQKRSRGSGMSWRETIRVASSDTNLVMRGRSQIGVDRNV
ncbi:MAG: hypothetical protein Pars2KO_32100 [Parasphingorhabdus sp.]